jgi:hypothetical protein
MKTPWLKLLMAANLVVLVALVFVYPQLMISPGALVKGHAELATDCFACHASWRGAASDLCLSCHALPDIGVRTTKGQALPQRSLKTAFHQDLVAQDCMACHSDHQGPKLTQRSRKPFSHTMLRTSVQDRCASCHARPADSLHRDLQGGCGECHTSDRWKPATFRHTMLSKAVLENCQACHRAPADNLHRQAPGACGQCHGQQAWKPATFDHAKLFVLDRDHNAACVTCHAGNDYQRYTCYGCHEHTPDRIRSKHQEEGIANFENCVECHRSASGEAEGKGRKDGGRSGRRERD